MPLSVRALTPPESIEPSHHSGNGPTRTEDARANYTQDWSGKPFTTSILTFDPAGQSIGLTGGHSHSLSASYSLAEPGEQECRGGHGAQWALADAAHACPSLH